MFTVSNENEAWYIEKNVEHFIGQSAVKSYEYGKIILINLRILVFPQNKLLILLRNINITVCRRRKRE